MRKIFTLSAALALLANAAFAANVPAVTLGQSSLPGDLPDVNQAIANVNAAVTSQSMATYTSFRNLLDNGAINITQRGTTGAAGGTTSGVAYPTADRWAVDTNVGSGAGYGAVITSSPTPPVGFSNAMSVYRNSGALTQPVCVMQEVPTGDAVALQGQQATFSFYAQALSGLSADNGNVINAYIMYGTGTDEGLASLTASPAITPAWTGINSSITASYTLSASNWNRYTLTGSIPNTAKEVGVAICFTPTATGAGSTDGFAFTGAQLEQGAAASSFEFRSYTTELLRAQRYYWQWAETASSYAASPFVCTAQSSTVAVCAAQAPVQMRATPTVACTYGTLKRMVGGTQTALSACAAAATTNGVSSTLGLHITATVASGDTAGYSGTLVSGNSTGGGLITATADF